MHRRLGNSIIQENGKLFKSSGLFHVAAAAERDSIGHLNIKSYLFERSYYADVNDKVDASLWFNCGFVPDFSTLCQIFSSR